MQGTCGVFGVDLEGSPLRLRCGVPALVLTVPGAFPVFLGCKRSRTSADTPFPCSAPRVTMLSPRARGTAALV